MDWWIVSGGGGKARSQLCSLHQHGGGETGGAGDFSSKVTTGPRYAERQGWPGGDANTEVWYLNMGIDQELEQLHITSSSFFCCSNNKCAELSKELANQKEEFYQQVTCTREELESEVEVLQRRLEGLGRERDGREMLHYFNSNDTNACFLTVFLCVSADPAGVRKGQTDSGKFQTVRDTQTRFDHWVFHHNFFISCSSLKCELHQVFILLFFFCKCQTFGEIHPITELK